jgi:hypothetical protein
MRSVVVFPQPDGPSSEKKPPFGIRREIPSTARWPGYLFARSWSSRLGCTEKNITQIAVEEEEKMRKRRQKPGVRSQNGTSDGTVEHETAGFRLNGFPAKTR